MSSSQSDDKPLELNLSVALKQCGVKNISRQGALVRINHSLDKNGKPDWTTILFEVKKDGFLATLQDFDRNCQKNKIPRQTVQQIMAALSPLDDDDYYVDALKYYDGNKKSSILGTAIKIGDFFEDGNNNNNQLVEANPPITSDRANDRNHQQHEHGREGDDPGMPTSASPPPLPTPPQSPEVKSDSDYPGDNDGLDLLTVSEVLQLDRPQPVRVIGLVDVVRTRFDLVKQIVLTCNTDKCPNRNIRETRTLKVGMFSVYDLPYVFPDGREALDIFCRCILCRQPRRVEAGQGRYQWARIGEINYFTILLQPIQPSK